MRAWRIQFHWHVTLPPFGRWISTEPIPCAKGAWHISSYGRFCNKMGHVSLGYLLASGYRTINLAAQKFLVHRVVKLTFHGPPKDPNMWQVHHRDGDKQNNHLENLDFVNNSLNVQHSYADRSRRCGGPKMWKPVEWRRVGSQDWIECPSVTAAAHRFGVAKCTMSTWCRSKHVHKGYEFRFQDINEDVLPGEEWRMIRDPATGAELPGRMVSSLGRVRLQHGFVYRGYMEEQGYYRTSITSNGISVPQSVHRLVANAFLGPPPTKHRTFINHKDGFKGNNTRENLEYVTHAENVQHHFSRSRRIPRQPHAKARAVLSRAYGSDSDWTHHPSITSAAQALAVHRRSVSICIRGVQKQTGGYEFRLADVNTNKSLPGEKWLPINLSKLVDEKGARIQAALQVQVKDTLEQWFFTPLLGRVRPCRDQEICQTLFVLRSMMRQLEQRREWWKRQLERVVDVSILPRRWSVFLGVCSCNSYLWCSGKQYNTGSIKYIANPNNIPWQVTL